MVRRTTLCMLFGTAVSTAAIAQQQETPKVVVVDSGSKELKRAAARLRVPVAQLGKARTALEGATDTARQTEPSSPHLFGQLARLWIELHRPAARAKLDALAGALRSRAEETEDSALYDKCTVAAQQVLPVLGQIDPERAVALARSWPAPRGESRGPDGAP